MPFNVDLAVAAMPQGNGPPTEDQLRIKYPELAFFFDEVSDLRELVEGHDAELRSAHDDGYDAGHNEASAEAAGVNGRVLTWAAGRGRLLLYVDGVLVDDLHGVRLGIILGDISSAYRKIYNEPQGDETDEKAK